MYNNESRDLLFKNISLKLKMARLNKGLTQSKLSQLSGIRQGDISRFETNTYMPDFYDLYILSNVLGLDLKDFFVF